jgi:hypothetical protein
MKKTLDSTIFIDVITVGHMKSASISELRKELKYKTKEELFEYCLALARYKVESKELLTYLVFESEDETSYIENVKSYIDNEFTTINTSSYHYMKKSIRKILRQVKRYIRYSKQKETETAVLLHFCECLVDLEPNIFENTVLTNMYRRQKEMAIKAMQKLHEDLQYDYKLLLEALD